MHNGEIEDSEVAVSGRSPFHLPFFFLSGITDACPVVHVYTNKHTHRAPLEIRILALHEGDFLDRDVDIHGGTAPVEVRLGFSWVELFFFGDGLGFMMRSKAQTDQF